ncbi:hypothetical protein KIM372_02560 [Bombiscardovia nodaiensis]|uniref:Uncharacterized protein n=1 Tax=Bombiscardovia nodaiensis TaxID=2932181 RepID=A0ABN6S886_9BIFI|nr:hypothetical protein KIM372_02560 [Bombiscardovia nodaiensis]
MSAVLAVLCLAVFACGSSLAKPTTAHANPPVNAQGFWLTPDMGTPLGGTDVTIGIPDRSGLKFTSMSANDNHFMGIGDDGNIYDNANFPNSIGTPKN